MDIRYPSNPLGIFSKCFKTYQKNLSVTIGQFLKLKLCSLTIEGSSIFGRIFPHLVP
jgi:hypothetical protein